ncbi:hypothetical protein PSTT_13346 [Puccinia striiformis]|uniref:Uncharacterized protein n=1 Tax=Puccinia striiformis TaxID=27350 RepID=A0A2S4US03_9BASI|nr:hypothetical protein PSTT_13346 [Puccinia striiformis]
MGLMDTDSHKDMSDRLTQVSADQKMQEASYVQSPPTPVQVLHSYHVPPHSPAHDSGPGSLDSLVLDTPINTLVASSMGRYVKPGSEDRQRKRLRDWQSTLTGFKGQGFHPEPSHLDRGILEFGHPRAPQMNQMSPSYTSTRFKIHRNEGQQPKLARNGKKIPAVNQGQGIIYNKIIHYPEYSMADLGQASEGQPNQPLKLLQYKHRRTPQKWFRFFLDDLKNHIMEILRPHLPQTVPENLDDIKPPTEPLNLLSYIIQKLSSGDQIKPYKAFYQDRMEVFNPQYGIPILGKVYIQNWINAPLGPLQIWLMKLLQANQSIYTTAVAISAIWFKETLSQQWAMHFQDDYHFWGFANNFFITHILPIEQQLDVSKLNQALGNFRYNSHKSSGIWDLGIGDFKVTSPPHSIHIIRKRPTPRAEASIKILNKQKHLHSLARGARDIHAKNKDLGIAIAKYCQGVDDYFYIRVITKETEKLTSPDDQRRSLSSFVDSLDAYSSFMISSLFTPSRPQNFHQEIFLDWVHLKLFGNDADSILPIQGRVDQSFFNQPIVPTFDEVQIFILENNCRQMNTKNLHAALVLFGYWLKTEHKEIWNEEFETDEAFSRFVYNLKWTSF